jgi:pimeloyl-ACP methyl ester carboxylesterase
VPLSPLPFATARPRLALVAIVLAITAFCAGAGAGAAAAAPAAKPTVVLVHGAFADASGWSGEISRLQRRGYPVVAPANPLRDVYGDAAYLKAVLATIRGPIVLVGHSYGGFVITNAATGNPNVKALVYIAAYAPREGDTVAQLNALAPGSLIAPAVLDFLSVPGPDGGAAIQEAVIKPSAFREIFAADVDPRTAAVMAASQRPDAAVTLGQPSGPPAWRTIPSWYLVAGRDKAIGTGSERIMARWTGAHTREVAGASHAVLVSRPDVVTDVILDAARHAR